MAKAAGFVSSFVLFMDLTIKILFMLMEPAKWRVKPKKLDFTGIILPGSSVLYGS